MPEAYPKEGYVPEAYRMEAKVPEAYELDIYGRDVDDETRM